MPAERFPFSERFQTYEARVSAPTKACLAPRHGYSSRSAHRSTARSSGLCLFLFEFSAIALIVMDGNNRIILVNSKAGKLFGCGRAELFAETIDTLTLEGIRFTNAGSPKVVRFVASGKTDRKCRSRSVGVRFRLKAAGARWSPSSISRSTKRQRSGSFK